MIAPAANSLAAAWKVRVQAFMKRQITHADWALLLRGHLPERANIQLRVEIELASSIIKNLLDGPAFLLMLFAVFVLTILVAIPNALAGRTILEGVTLLSARRTHLGRRGGPISRGGFGIIILSFNRFAERHGAELLSRRRCSFLFR